MRAMLAAAVTFLERINPGWRSRPLLLPVAVGLTALLPWHAANVLQSWHSLSPSNAAAATEAPKAGPGKADSSKAEAPKAGSPAAGQSGSEPSKQAPGGTEAAPSAATLAANDYTGAGDTLPADGRLLTELSRRKNELARREQDLQTRETQLAVAVQLAKKQMAELTQMRQALDAIVGREAAGAAGDLNLLVAFYANMKPVQAAAVLGKLEAPKAAAILQRLDARMAGPILASMDPSAALAITEELQQRRSTLRR
jgi:flagellar motility protein MotE (MotC chaperone)